MAKKGPKPVSYGDEKTKVESMRRKKRRMKMKAKGISETGESIIEKFSASSSKSSKFTRTKSKGKGKKKG